MQTSVISGAALDPLEWDQFVRSSPQGNIYHCHAYLSNLPGSWEAVTVRDGDGLVAALPYFPKKKWGIGYTRQPHFAQYLGILLAHRPGSVYKNLEFQKKAIQHIHAGIPAKLAFIDQYFAPEYQYDLPLLWLGWKQRIRITYWVDIGAGYPAFLEQCASHVRREIKKADQAGLRVEMVNDPEQVVAILKTAKPEATRRIPAPFFDALCRNARHFYPSGNSCCLIGYDGTQPVAGIIYFFFGKKMIYYQGSTLPEYKNSGIMSRIIAESVRLFADRYSVLDFDGSMLEPIERFFRGFGAFPVRYNHFRHVRLPRLLARIAAP